MRFALLLACAACGGSSPIADASIVDAPITDSSSPSNEAGDADADAQKPCKVGLPSMPTTNVACGSTSCMTGEKCCTSTNVCQASCAQLDLGWACDRAAHCGANQFCCTDFLNGDLSKCPAPSSNTDAHCQSTPCMFARDVCQVDADCPTGKTCYGATRQVRPAFGICI